MNTWLDRITTKLSEGWSTKLLITAMVVTPMLAGCAPVRQAAVAVPAAAAAPVANTAAVKPPAAGASEAVHWVAPDEPENAGLIEAFGKAHPEFKVDVEHDDNYGYEFNLHLAPLPSIFTLGTGFDFAQALDKHYAADLTDIWRQSGLLDTVPASLQRLSARNGKQYYVPSVMGWEGFWYNKDVFAKYNLQPPKTWDEFLALNDTLRSHGETPLAIGANGDSRGYWLQYLVLRMYGAQVYQDLANGHIPFSDPRLRHVLETWQTLFTRGDFPAKQMDDDQAMMAALTRGDKSATDKSATDKSATDSPKAVMALTDNHVASQVAPELAKQLGFFRFPIMNPAVPVTEATFGEGYLAPARQPLSPATAAFLSFAASPAGQAAIAQGRTDMGSMRGDLGDKQGAAQQQAIEHFRQADDAVQDYYGTMPGRMIGMVNDALSGFINSPLELDNTLHLLDEARRVSEEKGAFADSRIDTTASTTQGGDLVGKLMLAGTKDATSPVSDALIFQVDAADPAVAGKDSAHPEVDGIDHVDFDLYAPDGTHLYHHLERWAPYCGFDDGDPCNIYVFADHNYKWPKGQPIVNGPVRMLATIYTRDARVKTIDSTVMIQGIPGK